MLQKIIVDFHLHYVTNLNFDRPLERMAAINRSHFGTTLFWTAKTSAVVLLLLPFPFCTSTTPSSTYYLLLLVESKEMTERLTHYYTIGSQEWAVPFIACMNNEQAI